MAITKYGLDTLTSTIFVDKYGMLFSTAKLSKYGVISTGGGSGSVGGTAAGTGGLFLDSTFSNFTVEFTTLVSNITITSVDMYSASNFSGGAYTIGVYSGATLQGSVSGTITPPIGGTNIKITVTLNTLLSVTGNYNIRIATTAGTQLGTIVASNLTSSQVNITGNLVAANGTTTTNNVYNNLQFTY